MSCAEFTLEFPFQITGRYLVSLYIEALRKFSNQHHKTSLAPQHQHVECSIAIALSKQSYPSVGFFRYIALHFCPSGGAVECRLSQLRTRFRVFHQSEPRESNPKIPF